MKTLKIRYDAINGMVVPDGNVADTIDKIINDWDNSIQDYWVIGSELLLTGIRVAIRQGRIDHENVEIYYNINGQDNIMYPDKNGLLDNWPIGFADYNDKYYHILAGWGSN